MYEGAETSPQPQPPHIPELSSQQEGGHDFQYDPEAQSILVRSVDRSGTIKEQKHPFQELLYSLRNEGVQATTSEWLDLQRCLAEGQVQSLDDLYVIARSLLVKDVSGFPSFDTVFGRVFYGVEPPKPKNEDEWSDEYEEPEEEPQQERDQDEAEDEATEEPIQKEKEDIEEVVEATTKTSEDVHGGDEATKDIEDSPNAANEGKQLDNHGAEKGKSKENQKKKGEGGGQQQQNAQGGGNQQEKGQGGGDKNTEGEGGDGEKENDAGGGKRLEKAEGVVKEGKGGFSARERVMERRYDGYDKDKILGYEQFSQVLAKLTTIMRDATTIRTSRLDQLATARSIAQHGGVPEFVWEEEAEEKPKVVVLFDVGGSTDEFRPIMEKLFAAAKDTIDELDVYYFHNAIYGDVWPQKDGNWGEHFIPMREILKRDENTRVIIVGDAWMAEGELHGGGSYYDEQESSETGYDNFRKIQRTFPHTVWVNPILERDHEQWDNSGTIADIKGIFPMYDLTLRGLENAVRRLMEE